MTRITGSCLCGDVRYELAGPLRPVVYCHCEQCRKTSGHFVAATACEPEQLTITSDVGLRWYQSSPIARRGFCENCGASIFWSPEQGKYLSVMAGTIDSPTGLKAEEHVFVADASDYYTIDDGLPQHTDFGPVGFKE